MIIYLMNKKKKLIYDNIHGYIELDPLCLNIIDSPEFQRLRNIKQLGACYYVFPNATHSRFEHSLGVSHLAKEMITNISFNQPELNITKEMIVNIQIAGLCHDLGHGPYSHLFDNHILFDNKSINNIHEMRSCHLLEELVKNNTIELSCKQLDIIKELIHPQNRKDLNLPDYMYQIVSNVFNGIDVDKFDYLKRDCYMLGLSYSFDYHRIISQARVISNQICFPEKIYHSIYQIFITRWRLHTEIYTHPVVRCIEWMIVDCLKIANKDLNIIDSIEDMSKFYKIDDSILKIIEYLDIPETNIILDRIKKRDLYDFIGEIKLTTDTEINLEKLNINKLDIVESDLILDIVKIGYNEDPIKNVYFYDLNNLQEINNKLSYRLDENHKSNIIPTNFSDIKLRIYVRNREKKDVINQLFNSISISIK